MVTRATLAESALIETSKGPFPDAPGVYAIFDKEGKLQYMGLSRRVSASIDIHQKDLPELCVSAKVSAAPDRVYRTVFLAAV